MKASRLPARPRNARPFQRPPADRSHGRTTWRDRYDNAVQQARRTLEIEPGYAPALIVLGRALLFEGRFDEGIAALREAGREYEHMLALGFAMAGRSEEAQRLLTQILSPSYDRAVVSYDVALIYVALGDQTRAMAWLEKAHTEKHASMTELAVDPMLDPIRNSPRFKTLVERSTRGQ